MWPGWRASDCGLHWQAVALWRPGSYYIGLGENASNAYGAQGGGWKENTMQRMNSEICMQFLNDFLPFAEPAHQFLQPPVKATCPVAEKIRANPLGSASPHAAAPQHLPCCCVGTGHLCCQQQEEHGVGVPWTKVLAKTPVSPLNAAALRRKVGSGSSECGSTHWRWQCCGAVAKPIAEGEGGKFSVAASALWTKQRWNSPLAGGRAQLVPPPLSPWWLEAHLSCGWPSQAAAVRWGVRPWALKAHSGTVACCFPTVYNFAKMGGGPSRNGVPAAPHLAW